MTCILHNMKKITKMEQKAKEENGLGLKKKFKMRHMK